jgi:hypothetical protein
LNSAALGGNSIVLCANSQITLTGSINVNTNSAFTLQCASVGTCTINGNGSYTIVINAANVAIAGITFQNCKSSDNVSGDFEKKYTCCAYYKFTNFRLLEFLLCFRVAQLRSMLFPKDLVFKVANSTAIQQW